MSIHNKFPDNFPQGCPPINAKSEKIKVYRLVHGNKLKEDDFKSYVQLGKKFKPSEKYRFIEYGLSVNTSYEELKMCRKSSIYLKKKFKKIAKGYTYNCTGVILATPNKNQNNHHTWWLYEGTEPCNFFKVIGSEDDGEK